MIYEFMPKLLQRHTVHRLHPINSNSISVILWVTRLYTLLTYVIPGPIPIPARSNILGSNL